MKNKLLLILIIQFLILTILVKLGYTKSVDNDLYQFIMKMKTNQVTDFFKAITKLGNLSELIIMSLIFLIIVRDEKGIMVIINIINVQLLNVIVKWIVKRNRPTGLRLIEESYYSYPSGHAMLTFIIYGFLIYLIYKRMHTKLLKWIFIIMVILIIMMIGISRIYLGVHYFSDIIGGYLLSLIYLMIGNKIWRNNHV